MNVNELERIATMAALHSLQQLAEIAADAGAGGYRRDVLNAIVLRAASEYIDDMFEAGNDREDTAIHLSEQVAALVVDQVPAFEI